MGDVVDNYFLYNAGGIRGTIWYANHTKVATKKVDGKVCYVVTAYPKRYEALDYPNIRLDETAKKVKFYFEKETGLPLKCEEEYDSGTETITYGYKFDVVSDSIFQELQGYEEVK